MIKVNLGCGWRNFGNDWHHVDGGDYDHLDSDDIFNLPFDSNSVDLIYASHVVEYFDKQQISDIIKKWYNKLKSGGVLRIGVPNFKVITQLYQDGKYTLDNFIGLLYGKMPMGDETIYHKMTYDYNTLSKLLYDTGFTAVKEWDWRTTEHKEYDDHSQAYLPHMDKENGILMSLNVEGIK